jgi:hypothetical protein
MRPLLRTARYWLPIVVGFAALIGTSAVPPLVGWGLFVLGFGLLLDAATALFARASRTGGLGDNRQ